MINFNKKDPVADIIRGIMEKELKGNQTKLDKNHNGKLDGQDFKILRGQKKATEDVEPVEEGAKPDFLDLDNDGNKKEPMKKATDDKKKPATAASNAYTQTSGYPAFKKKKVKEDVEPVEENAFDYKSPRQPEPNGGSGVKKGARYGGSKQKEKPEQEEPKEKMTLKKMKEGYEEPILDELINEVLSKNADAGDWIHDFVHSDNPKFEGKSTVERKKMALGAYYAKQDEEVNEGLKSFVKKAFKTLTGGSDEDQRKNLQKKMGVPETGKKPTKEEVVVEGRQPTSQMDTPFVTDAENKPLGNAKELAAKTMKRMKNEMLGKTGTSE
jgi:hypothetical protein